MCLQSRQRLTLAPWVQAQLQRLVNKQRMCKNGTQLKDLGADEVQWALDLRSSCIHCIKGPYMTFGQNPETYATAINILDAALWKLKVRDAHVSILGVACFSLACKLTQDDENIPGTQELAQCCGHSWSSAELCRMEMCLMRKLDWFPPTVTYLHFLPLFAEVYGINPQTLMQDRYIMYAERCLRAKSTVLLQPEIVALALVHHVMDISGPFSLDTHAELLDACQIDTTELAACRVMMTCVTSAFYKPRPLPTFCPKVRHGKKRFSRPSNKGSPKLSTIAEDQVEEDSTEPSSVKVM